MSTTIRLALLTSALLLSACASTYQSHPHTLGGAAAGAVAGGLLGHEIDDDNGRYIGAAGGAIVGGAVGKYMDYLQRGQRQPPPRAPYGYAPAPSRHDPYPSYSSY